MNKNWKYVPFSDIFRWCDKSNIGSTQGKASGKYKLYTSSRTEIKYYDEFIADGESLVFGTGGNPSIHYVTGKFSYTNHCETAQRNKDCVYTKFYFYYFQKDEYAQLNNTFVGGGIKNSSKKKIGSLFVPLPPLPEQERIVARIEEMFSQLDNGVETLKKSKQQLAVYRQAVLKEAFIEIENKQPIREISSIVTSGSRGWAKYYSDSGARFIRITDLTRNKICLKSDSIQYVSLPSDVEGKRSKLEPNDVLVSITADLGSIALVPSTIGEAYINQHIAMIRFDNSEQGEYMAWYLKSDFGQKDLLKNKRGAGKLGLGLDDIRDTPVPTVNNEIAKNTVLQIESKLSVCDSIEQTIDTALQQAEALRQSILKKAFEGGL